MFGKKMIVAKPPAMKVAPAPPSALPPAMPTHPTLHASMAPKPLGAQDPQVLEQALLRRMKRLE